MHKTPYICSNISSNLTLLPIKSMLGLLLAFMIAVSSCTINFALISSCKEQTLIKEPINQIANSCLPKNKQDMFKESFILTYIHF